METHINCVVFEFDTNCPNCDETDEGPYFCTVDQILESGTPGCEHCGRDWDIKPNCIIRA